MTKKEEYLRVEWEPMYGWVVAVYRSITDSSHTRDIVWGDRYAPNTKERAEAMAGSISSDRKIEWKQ